MKKKYELINNVVVEQKYEIKREIKHVENLCRFRGRVVDYDRWKCGIIDSKLWRKNRNIREKAVQWDGSAIKKNLEKKYATSKQTNLKIKINFVSTFDDDVLLIY